MSTKDLHEALERNTQITFNQASAAKQASESAMKIQKYCRCIDFLLVALLSCFYFFEFANLEATLAVVVIWLLVNPSAYFYRQCIEYASDANLSFSKAEILSTKNEVLYELDNINKKIAKIEKSK